MAVGDILKLVDQEDFTKAFNTDFFSIQNTPVTGNVGILVSRTISAGVVSKVQVSIGAIDSGGSGYRVLRIPN